MTRSNSSSSSLPDDASALSAPLLPTPSTLATVLEIKKGVRVN